MSKNIANKINKLCSRVSKIEKNFTNRFIIKTPLDAEGDVNFTGRVNILGNGTQVESGRLDKYIPILDGANMEGFADNFIELLEKIGFPVSTELSCSDTDVRIMRNYTRVGNNIVVNGTFRIRVCIESALFVMIIILQQIGLMPFIEIISSLILDVTDKSYSLTDFDVNDFISIFENLKDEVDNIINNGLNTVPFIFDTITEKNINEKYKISEQTFMDDCTNESIIIDEDIPSIGSGRFSSLRTDLLAKQLEDLVDFIPEPENDTFIIPVKELACEIIDGILTPLNTAIENLGGSTIDVNKDDIKDIEVPVVSITDGLVKFLKDIIGILTPIITLIIDLESTQFTIEGKPDEDKIDVNLFGPISNLLINKLYEITMELMSIVNTITGDFKIPPELIKKFAEFIGIIIQTFVVGEGTFEYNYRCDENQIPTF